MSCAPPFIYYGGKTAIARQIADLLPPHGHYVEPFAGSLSVLLAKPRSPMETVNDLDGDLMTFWRVLRDQPDQLQRSMILTPHSRAEYASAYDLDSAPSDLERARRMWVLLTQGRSAAGQRRTGWRGYVDTNPGLPIPYARRVPACARRLVGVMLESRDALDLIDRYGRSPDVLIYADPPYLGSTRSTGYHHELSTEAQHRDLAAALRGCAAAVVLSGYHDPLYDELYVDWYVTEIATVTRNAPPLHQARTEVLWSNRPLGQPDLFSARP